MNTAITIIIMKTAGINANTDKVKAIGSSVITKNHRIEITENLVLHIDMDLTKIATWLINPSM
jgi:hypothetical protein